MIDVSAIAGLNPPDVVAEIVGYSNTTHEDKLYWQLLFRLSNRDSRDYETETWEMRLYDNEGDLIAVRLKLETGLDTTLLAGESLRIPFRTQFAMEEDLFHPEVNIEDSESLADAEKYLDNLMRFRDMFWSDELLLLNDKLELRQRLSISDYFEKELARRRAIVDRLQKE